MEHWLPWRWQIGGGFLIGSRYIHSLVSYNGSTKSKRLEEFVYTYFSSVSFKGLSLVTGRLLPPRFFKNQCMHTTNHLFDGLISPKVFHSWTQCLWNENSNRNQGKLNATTALWVTAVICHRVTSLGDISHMAYTSHCLELPKPLQHGLCSYLTALDCPKSIPFAYFRTRLQYPLFEEAIPRLNISCCLVTKSLSWASPGL